MEAAALSLAPAAAVGIPLAASILILASGRYPNIRESWTLIAAVATFLSVLSLAPQVLAGGQVGGPGIPFVGGLSLALRVDAAGLIFALTSSGLWILNSIYSIGYMRTLQEHDQTRFYCCFAVSIASVMGLAFSANIITMFLWYEILTVFTYPLVVHEGTPAAMRAGRKYIAYLLVSGVFFLFAAVTTYWLTGTLDFTPGGILSADAPPLLLSALFVAYLIAFAKAAWMPLHSWLPSAMVAPTPVSALLHAVAVVKAGVFGMVRTVGYVYGIDLTRALGMNLLLAAVAAATIILGSIFALRQDSLKKRLAYSTVSQLSYILLGLSLLSPAGIEGALMHIPFHAVMKITLFFCAGAVISTAGKEYISQMRGIGRTMPVTMAMFGIAAVGICGLPPVCGLVSKWFLLIGTAEAGLPLLTAVMIASAVLNAAYFFPIIHTAFFERSAADDAVREAPLAMLIPLVLTAAASVLFFFVPDLPFGRLAALAAAEITGVRY